MLNPRKLVQGRVYEAEQDIPPHNDQSERTDPQDKYDGGYVVNAGDSAACGKSFTSVKQEYEARKIWTRKGGAETQVDLADDDPEGADWPPSVRAGTSP